VIENQLRTLHAGDTGGVPAGQVTVELLCPREQIYGEAPEQHVDSSLSRKKKKQIDKSAAVCEKANPQRSS